MHSYKMSLSTSKLVFSWYAVLLTIFAVWHILKSNDLVMLGLIWSALMQLIIQSESSEIPREEDQVDPCEHLDELYPFKPFE